ncbi:hypothetical protein J4450_04060 [Candidatus Micrarchaeota archaeon]|nr:hypothetical protein [Candidatus Micrarchaeota archaeon]
MVEMIEREKIEILKQKTKGPVLTMLTILLLMMIGSIMLTKDDLEYLNSITKVKLFGLEITIMIFILIYGTPVYILIVILSRIAQNFNIETLKTVFKKAEEIASILLIILSFGFIHLYLRFTNTTNEERKKQVSLLLGEIIGIVILVAFYLRLLEGVLGFIIVNSIFLWFMSIFLGTFKSEKVA